MWKHYKAMRMAWLSVLMNLCMPIGLTMLGIHLYHIANGMMAPNETDAGMFTSRFEIKAKVCMMCETLALTYLDGNICCS